MVGDEDSATTKPQGNHDEPTARKMVSGKPGGRQGKPKGPRLREKKRMTRTFPASTFEDALVIPMAIQQFAAGQRVRRLTLFEHLKKSPESGPSRQLISNSTKYGLTKGGYQAEHLELTPDGSAATNPEGRPEDKLAARFRLAIEGIAPFNDLYQHLRGSKLPDSTVMRDYLIEKGYSRDEVAECVDTFVLNAKFLGLLRTIAGAERLLPVEQTVEEAAKDVRSGASLGRPQVAVVPSPEAQTPVSADWSKICFYITPIGIPESDERKHSDLFLGSIVEPAVEEFGLTVVRADQIAKPGMITAQVIEHIVKSRLVIADLSFHNPNVFYELCVRHLLRLPTVHIIRVNDSIPFDLDQFRTITIDTTNIYTLVPQLQTYRSDIANQIRRTLDDPETVENPLTVFYPSLRAKLES